jgi:hypothetical protein
MYVAFLTGSTNYSSACNTPHVLVPERQGQGHSPLVAGDGVPHQEIEQLPVEDKDAAVTAIQNVAVSAVFDRRKKRDAGMLSGAFSVEVNSMLESLS